MKRLLTLVLLAFVVLYYSPAANAKGVPMHAHHKHHKHPHHHHPKG